jgi:O-acetyl-ADP-ribose deacetylase (regulator of RNase III)
MEIIKGDICEISADAIVNAANSSLCGGGGVDGAIHKRAGNDSLNKACSEMIKEIGICHAGGSVYTSAFALPAKYIIHTVGPIWYGGFRNESITLAKAYASSLKLALELNCESIAFPNISVGAYGFPKDLASDVAIETCRKFLLSNNDKLKVIFVCFEDDNYRLYLDKIGKNYTLNKNI